MEAKIQKQVVDYFSFFEEFHSSSKTCLKDCQNCAVVINKLIVRCRKIKESEVHGSPLEDFDELQSKLIATLHNLISDEIREIRGNLSKIEDLLETLDNKRKVLREICKDIDFSIISPLVNGTPYQPPLKEILQFAEDTFSFGSDIYAQIDTSLSVLTFKGLHTEFLLDNFKIPSAWRQRIPEILAYTSFCPENKI